MSDTQHTVDSRVETYIKVRTILKQKKAEYEKSIEALVDLQNGLTDWLQTFLENSKVDSAKTKHGTVYKSTKYSASLADPEAFMAFVKANDRFDLMDRKANAVAVKEYVEANTTLPPGVNLTALRTVGVRSPKGGAAQPDAE